VSWTYLLSENAKAIAVVVNQTAKAAFVATQAVSSGTVANIVITGLPSGAYNCYVYVLDKRGSAKVGSPSVYGSSTVTKGVDTEE